MRSSLIALICLALPSIAGAQPATETPPPAEPAPALPFEETVSLGAPARDVTVRVALEESGPTLTLRAGRTVNETLPLRAADRASVERLEVAPGHHVGIVRVAGEAGEAAAVIDAGRGAPVLLWSGRTDFHGDPGERSAAVLELRDRTGDDRPDVVVGVRREGVRICGADADALLVPRAYDPAAGRMRPVTLRRLPHTTDLVTVTATRQSPGPEGAPLLDALSPIGASSTAGHGEELSGLGPPRALTDADPATYWAEGRGGTGAEELVVLRWTARFPIHAIALTLAPTANAAQLGRVRELTLVGDQGPRLRVTIPEDALPHPGERYWIVPPEPLSWRCLTLVLDGAYSPRGVADAAVHTGIAEVEAYTELDLGGGLDALVAILVEGGEGGDEAARLLTQLGEPALDAVAAAWERLDEQGRRRAVRVFVSAARREIPQAVDALGTAAMDPSSEVRGAALQAMGTLDDRAGEMLGRLVQQAPPVGDEAVRPLLRHRPAITAPALLAAIEAEGGSERPIVREGLARALGGGDESAVESLRAWVAAGPAEAALASVVRGLAGYGPTRALAQPLLARAVEGAPMRFEDRWRVVGAARDLAADEAVDAWLAAQAREAEEWMIRAAAVEALGRRDAPSRGEIARRAMEDEYPRVRVEAIRVLDGLDTDDEALAHAALEDSWPMVRAAAIDALWDRAPARRVVRRGARDRSPQVRQSAIRALTRAGDREAWPLVRARLADDEEWPQVTVRALRYVRELCIDDADEVLLAVIERGLEPNAWAPDVDVAAVAADLAMSLGGDVAERARRAADRPDAPASIRAAIVRPRAEPPACRR